jgi:hypothetical protein
LVALTFFSLFGAKYPRRACNFEAILFHLDFQPVIAAGAMPIAVLCARERF